MRQLACFLSHWLTKPGGTACGRVFVGIRANGFLRSQGDTPPFQHTLAGHLAVPLWEVALGIYLPRADNMAARVGGAAPHGFL